MSKTVLITGGGQGIGAHIARKLHATGMNIIIHYNTSSVLATDLYQQFNAKRAGSAMLIEGDLARVESFERVFEVALKFTSQIDALINNASVFYPTPVAETSLDHWEDIMGVNLKAPFFMSKLFATKSTSPATIINITDIHGAYPLEQHSLYSISKAGLIMLTKSLAKELGPKIRVNAVSPGAITWRDSMTQDTKYYFGKTALRRAGTADDIADAVLFLMQQADYITGQVLTVDGGRTLYS